MCADWAVIGSSRLWWPTKLRPLIITVDVIGVIGVVGVTDVNDISDVIGMADLI